MGRIAAKMHRPTDYKNAPQLDHEGRIDAGMSIRLLRLLAMKPDRAGKRRYLRKSPTRQPWLGKVRRDAERSLSGRPLDCFLLLPPALSLSLSLLPFSDVKGRPYLRLSVDGIGSNDRLMIISD